MQGRERACSLHASGLILRVVVSGQVYGAPSAAHDRAAVACIGNQQRVPRHEGGQRCGACIPLWVLLSMHCSIEVRVCALEGINLHPKAVNFSTVGPACPGLCAHSIL